MNFSHVFECFQRLQWSQKSARKNCLLIGKNKKTRSGCLASLRMYPAFIIHTLDIKFNYVKNIGDMTEKLFRDSSPNYPFFSHITVSQTETGATVFLKVRFKKRYTVHTSKCIHTVLCSCRGLKYDDHEFHCFLSLFCCKIHCEMLLMLKGLYKQDI
jgi:hypothetical protein